jgi:pyridoxal 5'-phosphate synthase pdxS subunit
MNNGNNSSISNGHTEQTGTWKAKVGLAQMLKGGVIMDVVSAAQARVAEEAGAVSVMALERVPSDIRAQGGVARMSQVEVLEKIRDAVSIPVMAKCRIGHFSEARIVQALGLDYIDESEVLTVADPNHHVNKHEFKIPFVCGAVDLGQALRRISEGAAMIRTKGEAGTGDVVEAVIHMRTMMNQIRDVTHLPDDQLAIAAKELSAPYELVKEVKQLGRLPVVNFAAGGIATPADAALMMHLGAEGIFVGSGIFKASDNPDEQRLLATAIVEATTHYENDDLVAEASRSISKTMDSISVAAMPLEERMATRGT